MRQQKSWVIIPLAVLGLMLVAVVVQAILGVMFTGRYRRYVESLRAGGEPYWFDEVQAARAVIPEDENSARVIERIAEELRNLSNDVDQYVMEFGEQGPKLDPFHGTPRYAIEPTREFIKKHVHLLEALSQLRDRKRGRFDVQYDPTDPISTFLPPPTPVHHAVKLMGAAISIDIMDRNFQAATDRVPLLFRLCSVFHDEPFLINRLVQIANEMFAVRSLQAILCAGELTVGQLQSFDALLGERLVNPMIGWALRGERLWIDHLCSSLGRGLAPIAPPAGLFTISPYWTYAPPFAVRRNQLECTRILTLLAGKASDARALLATADQEYARVATKWSYSIILKDIVPSVHRAIELDVKSRVLLETARCAIAAERYRLKNEAFPDSLEILVPEYLTAVPVDPFGEGNLLVRVEDDAFTVYSVSEDRADDGGDVVIDWNSAKDDEPASDIGFRLLVPEKRGVIILDVSPPEEDE